MREISSPHAKLRTRRVVAGVVTSLLLYAALTAALYRSVLPHESEAPAVRYAAVANAPIRDISLRDGLFYVDRKAFFIRAVGWDPTRPGELPWKRQFHREELEEDLDRIRAAGFNTVRSWAPLGPEELELVEHRGLRVLQGIWVPPNGDFADPEFRRRTLNEVARATDRSRGAPAILAYLVLNEPRAQAVARAGLPATRSFLRELVATVRALDPTALVGYASWPGMEALDDELLDFTAFNIYPHRPRVVMDELGLVGYVRTLKQSVAQGRPLLISEFGISVSPGQPSPGRGGATEQQQADGLLRLSSSFLAAGVAGTSVFQWSDGWWKNNDAAGDELTHDPMDPEEWFGLIRFTNLTDRIGAARPALGALATFQKALLLEPNDGQVTSTVVPVRISAESPVTLKVAIDDGPALPISLTLGQDGLWTGTLPRSAYGIRHEYRFELASGAGLPIGVERRLLRTGPARGVTLAITPKAIQVSPGAPFTVELSLKGQEASRTVSISTFTEDRYNEERTSVRLGGHGRARVRLRAPHEETMLTVLAFEDDPRLPPSERATAWIPVQVRRSR
jgi:Glycosyl hydrolases family 2, TIM barrel domain